MKTVSQVLNEAADLLEPEDAWSQFGGSITEAVDQDGNPVNYLSDRAVSWCVLGALDRLDARHPAYELVESAANISPHSNLAEWNDAPGRTQADVVTALREAAKRAASTPEAK